MRRQLRYKANHILNCMRDGSIYGLAELSRTWGRGNPGSMTYAVWRMEEEGLVEAVFNPKTRANGYKITEKGIGTQEL